MRSVSTIRRRTIKSSLWIDWWPREISHVEPFAHNHLIMLCFRFVARLLQSTRYEYLKLSASFLVVVVSITHHLQWYPLWRNGRAIADDFFGSSSSRPKYQLFGSRRAYQTAIINGTAIRRPMDDGLVAIKTNSLAIRCDLRVSRQSGLVHYFVYWITFYFSFAICVSSSNLIDCNDFFSAPVDYCCEAVCSSICRCS